jgi:two-component system sensor histidine kinase/response regulator
VESEPGKGSTFTFTLDFDRLVEQEVQLDPSVITGKKILIIDPSPGRRTVFRDYCLHWDCEPEEAVTLSEGIEMLAHHSKIKKPYDLIFLDFDLDKLSDTELSQLKTNRLWKETPVILLTDQAPAISDEKLNGIGINVILRKPFLPQRLLNAMIQATTTHEAMVTKVNGHGKPQDGTPEKREIRILLAEDNLINQKVAMVTLEKLGHHVDLAENGLKAVELFRNNQYDLILMDIHMPDYSRCT